MPTFSDTMQMQDIQQQIDQRMLAGIVQRIFDSAMVIPETWNVRRIEYSTISPQSRGLYRVDGIALDGEARKAWSCVLKVIVQPSDHAADEPAAPFYWKREALAYQSELLSEVPGGLTVPRCYGVVEHQDHEIWIWLEDIQCTNATTWSLPRYGLVAHQFGTFGGTYLTGRPIPSVPWLSQHLIRTWVSDAAPLLELIQKPGIWDRPLLRHHFPDSVVASVLRLWRDREELFLHLEQLPQTICHQDVWRKNLCDRSRADGSTEVVTIDWELVGVGAAGEDIGNLLGVGLLNLDVKVDEADNLAESMLTHYLAGLGDTGWDGDARAIMYAFNTAAALRCVFSTAGWPVAILNDDSDRYVLETEQRWGRPVEDIIEQWAAVTTFLLERAAVARSLLPPS